MEPGVEYADAMPLCGEGRSGLQGTTLQLAGVKIGGTALWDFLQGFCRVHVLLEQISHTKP